MWFVDLITSVKNDCLVFFLGVWVFDLFDKFCTWVMSSDSNLVLGLSIRAIVMLWVYIGLCLI